MNMNELRDLAYKNAVAHGWHEENLSDEHFLCLVISELMEAVEADRKGMHANRDVFEYYMKQRRRDEFGFDELKCSEGFFDWTFTESIFFLVCNLTNTDFIETHSFDSYLRVALIEIMVFCVKKDIDIFWFIKQKMKYNELRPFMHGGKAY